MKGLEGQAGDDVPLAWDASKSYQRFGGFFSQRSCQSQRAVRGILGIFNSLLLSLGGLPHKTSKLLTGEMQEPRERHCEFLRLNEVQRVALLFSSVFDLHASVVVAVADVVAAVADA